MNDQEITQLNKDIDTLASFSKSPIVAGKVSIPAPSPCILIVTATKNPIHLTVPQGNVIKALNTKHCKMNQTEYASHINMDMALLSKYLSGELPITVQSLQRILSKITYSNKGFEAEWQTRILIRECETGPDVPNVDSIELGDQSLLEDNG